MDQVKANFTSVPKGYGEVAFYWWVGDKLTQERLLWQLDQLMDHHISGLQINYCHSDEGGLLWGLTYPSDPPLFSEEWWSLLGWFIGECKKRDISVSLSDYTLGSAGQGWFVDEMLALHPHLLGQILVHESGEVVVKTVENSFNPMQKGVGDAYNEVFYKRFEERFPGECGKGLNFFFSDELNFGVSGKLWCDDFEEQFQQRKGYAIRPHLKALFEDMGDLTPKIRLDYYDVIVSLSEERFFQVVYRFHEERHMIFGCDHGGRGTDVTEFGDYFRTMKWNQGPGNDQPLLDSNLIKNKVSSSIAHLYQRPRTWLEGFYGSGWGTSSADVADATFRNFAMGHNLLTLHGLYYTTLGGWWEWAPPCNHFRMPYWKHFHTFLACTERLSWLLAQGVHVCDVAILYPVAAMEGDVEEGLVSVKTAFQTAEFLYDHGFDFDFIDFPSIERAEIIGKELRVSGEGYKAVILPSMKTVRFDMLRKLEAFRLAGGTVICMGEPPCASDRIGRNDPLVERMGHAFLHADVVDDMLPVIRSMTLPDIEFDRKNDARRYFLHRRVDNKDIYVIYGAPKGEQCTFRASGTPERWNPWDGTVTGLTPLVQDASKTRMALPCDEHEVQVIVFSPDANAQEHAHPVEETVACIPLDGKWGFELIPTLQNRFGDYRLPASDEFIGAEIRFLEYQRDSQAWERVSCGYGPHFLKLGPVMECPELSTIEDQLCRLETITDKTCFVVRDQVHAFQEYGYSERFGVEGDPGRQGYHGLKGLVSDAFLVMGTPEWTSTSTAYHVENADDVHYFWATVHSEGVAEAKIMNQGLVPEKIWMNGLLVQGETVALEDGLNRLLLKYRGAGRSGFVLRSIEYGDDWVQTYPLSMKWYRMPGAYVFSPKNTVEPVIGRYRFQSPPALKEVVFSVYGSCDMMVDGNTVTPTSWTMNEDGSTAYRYALDFVNEEESHVALRIHHAMGRYGGAAFVDPIKMTCGIGRIALGDWSSHEGLYCYSGGVKYKKDFSLTDEQLRHRILLDLGTVVSSAEVMVNGRSAGVKTAPGWEMDISEYVRSGDNDLEVMVMNTLANHYTSIPTRYRGSLKSGLIGPVTLMIVRGQESSEACRVLQ